MQGPGSIALLPQGWPIVGSFCATSAASSMVPSQSSSRPLHTSGPPLPPAHTTWPRPTSQARVPAQELPGRVQGRPTPARSSVAPLQSLSAPSQISAEGLLPPRHWRVPPEQRIAPAVHSPVPQLPHGQQATPPPATSSVAPSQSSSWPLHSSARGRTSPTQPPQLDIVHCCEPARHGPTPSVPTGPP